jgi:hypothetical protein
MYLGLGSEREMLFLSSLPYLSILRRNLSNTAETHCEVLKVWRRFVVSMSVFCSYSHQDECYLGELRKHLKVLELKGFFQFGMTV